MSKLLIPITILIILATHVYAATVYGTVYDWDLELASDVIIKVNSSPEQMLVSKDGSYSFELQEGDYLIEAKEVINDITRASIEEEVQIKSEGSYVVDLILFPVVDIELLDEPDIISEEVPVDYGMAFVLIIFVIIILILLIVFYKKSKTRRSAFREDYEDLDKVIKIIKSEGGRTTQKDIRKRLPLSEAKISLIIAELEHKGIVQKIKKGRGNIIILKR